LFLNDARRLWRQVGAIDLNRPSGQFADRLGLAVTD